MSATTMKLPYKRFVAQVSTGAPRPKSAYLALMQENLEALKGCPWREAPDAPATLTGHDFTAATQLSDAYDAFKLTGNYDASANTEVAYAGMAAYRFTVPASAVSGGTPLTGVSLPVARDRYEKSGVHLAVALSGSAAPSADWDVVRGTGGLAASALLAPESPTCLTASSPASGSAEIDLSAASGNPPAYLWVYVTLEDYADHWTMYSAKEQRLYAVEGSAMLVGAAAEAAFAGDVAADPGSAAAYALCSGAALPVAGAGPAAVVAERQFTGDALPAAGAPAAAYKCGVPLAASAAGLRMAYADLLSGAAAPAAAAANAMRPGARFHVEAATAPTGLGSDVGVWRITASALAVPFAAPAGFAPGRVRLVWGASGAPVTPGLKWRVWVKDGSASADMPDLADAGFWRPGSASADGFALAGEFDAGAAAGSAEVPVSLDSPLATVAVTGFLPMDGAAFADGMATSFGCAAEFRPDIYLLP